VKKILNYGSTLQLFLTASRRRIRRPRSSIRAADAAEPAAAALPTSATSPPSISMRAATSARTRPTRTGRHRSVQFVKYERGQYVIADRTRLLAPNAPYLDRIVWRVITDRAAAAAQMEAGELH